MKVRNKEIAEILEELGWANIGETTTITVVGVYDEGDSRASQSMHDFCYGPLVRRKRLPATRMRRPEGVTRRLEREVMQLLISWQVISKLLDRREPCNEEEANPSYSALDEVAIKLVMAAMRLSKEGK